MKTNLVTTAGVAALSAVTIWARWMAGETHLLLALDLGAAVIALTLMTYRLPLGPLAANLLAALSPAASPPATASALIVAQRRGAPWSYLVAGTGIAAHIAQGLWRPQGGLSLGWWLALMTAAYAALIGWGALWKTRTELICSLRRQAHRTQQDRLREAAEARHGERLRIAREMHDILAHRLSLLATYAGAVEYRPDTAPEQLARAAGIVRDCAHQALLDLREVIGLLRADDTGDGPPQPTLHDLPHLLDESRRTGMRIDTDTDITADPPAHTGRTGYRIIQEALTNARKHAPAATVHLSIAGTPGTRLSIDVRNPMPGNDTQTPGSHTGLIGLSERVRLAGGELHHGPTHDGHFHLHASLPWPA